MGFLGTAVTTGKARGLVVATGRGTELGAIAGEVEETAEVETPLQRRITRLTQWIAVVILGIALLAFGVGWVAGRGLFEMLLLAVALAVAAIPAGLPIVVTVALAIGVERMARRHAVIRRLPAVDTLGSCTVILSDKTGTLTRNEMTVRALRTAGGEYRLQGEEEDGQARWPGRRWTGEGLAEDRAATWSLRTGALCNDLEPAADGSEDRSTGDPMEKALVAAAAAAGRESAEEEQRFPRVDEIPFRTERRYMATVHRVEEGGEESGLEEDGTFALVKGAPEAVLDLCDRVLRATGAWAPSTARSGPGRTSPWPGRACGCWPWPWPLSPGPWRPCGRRNRASSSSSACRASSIRPGPPRGTRWTAVMKSASAWPW